MNPTPSEHQPRRTIDFDRTYRASLEEVWKLWTTKSGIEAWWGPEGFSTEVLAIDLRPGGKLRYRMTATGAAEIDFMQKAGLPLSHEVGGAFAELEPMRRLVLVQRIDFVPGVVAYDTAARVELSEAHGEVRMTLRIDAHHDAEWTERARMGWESQLRRLAKRFQA